MSCLEDQVMTQQPAWIGQGRYVSSTTLDQLTTGSIFDLRGQKLREIGPGEDGWSAALLEKPLKLWSGITLQQSAWFRWDKLQKSSSGVEEVDYSINSIEGRKARWSTLAIVKAQQLRCCWELSHSVGYAQVVPVSGTHYHCWLSAAAVVVV